MNFFIIQRVSEIVVTGLGSSSGKDTINQPIKCKIFCLSDPKKNLITLSAL
jgi:hypothetical protein